MLYLMAMVPKQKENIMLKFKRIAKESVIVAGLLNDVRNAIIEDAYGDHAGDIKTFNTLAGALSWVQLIQDVHGKKGWKKTTANQLMLTAGILTVNTFYRRDVQAKLNDYLTK